jgi:hypothetical protein
VHGSFLCSPRACSRKMTSMILMHDGALDHAFADDF